jgi:hypothetical protein
LLALFCARPHNNKNDTQTRLAVYSRESSQGEQRKERTKHRGASIETSSAE